MKEINATDFGACGDGTADDTAALQKALDSGASRVVIPAGCYLIRRTLRPAPGQCLVLDGTIKIADAERTPLAENVSSGQNRISVEDSSLFQVGDSISIHDDNLPIQGGGRKVRRERAGHAEILAIHGNQLELDRRALRNFSVSANGFVSRQNGGIWIQHPGVRICGTGTLDGNYANQLNAAPGYLDVERSEVHPGASGIYVSGDDWIGDIVIEGIEVRDFVLHGISLARARQSVIRNVRVRRVHDKSIHLSGCQDCRITGNICSDSLYEDGIMLHQTHTDLKANRRIYIEGNLCRNNARYGIHIGAGHSEIHLANNLCVENGLNLSIYGDHCTSTGDVASGTTDRLFLATVYRPNVLLAGRHLSVSNLSARGTRFVGVEICGQQIQLSGGLIGEMEEPVACDEPGAARPSLGEWGRGSGEFFIDGDCRIGLEVVPGLTGPGKPNIPADVTVTGLAVYGCRLNAFTHQKAQNIKLHSLDVTSEMAAKCVSQS